MYTIALFTMESFTFKSLPNNNLTVLYEIVDTEFNKLDWLNEYPESIFAYYHLSNLGKLLSLKLNPYATKE